MNQKRKQQIHNIIEYIKRSGIRFDCQDVLENTQNILDHHGLISKFNQEEFNLIKTELLKIAGEYQTQEILYLIENHIDPLLEAIQTSKKSNQETETTKQKIILATIRQKYGGKT